VQTERGQMDVGLDGERVARQAAGPAEDRVGPAGARQGVPGEELLVGEGAPEEPGALESDPAVQLQGGAGIARNNLPSADEPKTARVRDRLAYAPGLRYITNLHAFLGKQFPRRKSTPVFHPPGGCRLERVIAISHAPGQSLHAESAETARRTPSVEKLRSNPDLGSSRTVADFISVHSRLFAVVLNRYA